MASKAVSVRIQLIVTRGSLGFGRAREKLRQDDLDSINYLKVGRVIIEPRSKPNQWYLTASHNNNSQRYNFMKNSSTSPFKSSLGGFQRRSEEVYEDSSLNLVVRSLEKENNTLAEEVALLRSKNRKVAEIEEQMEQILKHNNELLTENEKLAKLINQKKGEVEVWKSKFESHSAAKFSSQELEVKRLLNEIEKLKEEICEVEHLKSVQLNELKNQSHAELQHLKRANLSTCEMYELEIRKLKELVDKKDYEYGDLSAKMARVNKEMDFEINKLREERDRLKSDLAYEDGEHKREIESVKAKLELNFHGELENLKKQHYNEVEALDYENSKLKDVIACKNQEIQQILAKNLKVKQNYEESLLLVKRENDGLKDKLSDNQRIYDLELANLREKLEGMRDSEIGLLKNAHTNQLQILSNQINKLQAVLNTKNIEIQNLIKEKNQVRLSLETEVAKLRSELEARNIILKENSAQFQKQLDALTERLRAKEQEVLNVEALLSKQAEILQSELATLKSVLQRKAEDLERIEKTSSKDIRDLQARNQDLANKLTEIKEEHDRTKSKSSNDIDELRRTHQLKVRQLDERIKSLEEQNAQKDKALAILKSNLDAKEKDIDILQKTVAELQAIEKRLKKELDETKNRSINKENQYNRIIKEQRERMETNFNFELESHKNDTKNIVAGLNVEIKDLKKQIEAKNALIDDLRKKYEELARKFEELFAQQANRKALDIKQPGWIPETIATKGLFDVFVKNKVIEYCQ